MELINIFLKMVQDKSTHLLITILVFIIGTIPTIIGSAFYIDSRYAHAEELVKLRQIQLESIAQLRSSLVEDKVFELDLKQKMHKSTPIEDAMLSKYKREQYLIQRMSQKIQTK